MARRDSGTTGQPKRDQTDESLRVERQKVDVGIAEKRAADEDDADEVVRVARKLADEVVQNARDEADQHSAPQSPGSAATSSRERSRADAVLERERDHADVVIEEDRLARRRFLADFLEIERDDTDRHLEGERDHADTAIAARDEFLAIVSHDLRSLLAGLSLNSVVMARNAPEGAAGDPVRAYAAKNDRLILRIDRLISDLLDVASMEAGGLAIDPAPVEVAALLRDTRAAFEPIAASRHIALDVEEPAQSSRALLDAGRVLQVLSNLVANALKFTPADGRVAVRARDSVEGIEFTVSDTGIGIPADQLEAVFERFHQVSRDRRGLGLGLHIARGIVLAHGGRLWVESVLGAGSTFHFVLPGSIHG